jgi:hypothetical protein
MALSEKFHSFSDHSYCISLNISVAAEIDDDLAGSSPTIRHHFQLMQQSLIVEENII